MDTLKRWFDKFQKKTGEKPISIKFTRVWEEDCSDWPCRWNELINFHDLDDAVLNKKFDSGYGLQDVPDFLAWSENYVLHVYEYDGSTSLEYHPRNPQ